MATNVELEFKYLAIEEMSVTWQSVFFVGHFFFSVIGSANIGS